MRGPTDYHRPLVSCCRHKVQSNAAAQPRRDEVCGAQQAQTRPARLLRARVAFGRRLQLLR